MMQKAANKDMYWFHIVVFFVILIGFGFIPPIGNLTKEGMRIIGIFIAMLYGWTFIDLFMVSCMAIIALGFTEFSGYSPTSAAYKALTDSTVMISILALPVFYITEITGLCGKVGRWIASRKILVGRPWLFISVILLCTYWAGCFINSIALTFLMWSVLYNIFTEIGYKPGDALPAYVCAGVAFTAVYTWSSLPWMTVPLVAMGSLSNISGGTFILDYPRFMAVTIPMFSLLTLVYILIVRFIFKPDVSPLKNITNETLEAFRKDLKLTTEQLISAGLVLLFVFVVLVPQLFPGSKNAFIVLLRGIGIYGVSLICMSIACIVRINGKHIVNFAEMMAKGIKWEIIMMMAAAILVGNALSGDTSGFVATINGILSHFNIGASNVIIFLAIFLVLCILITQVAHNVTIVVVAIPILYPLCLQTGLNPLLMVILLNYCSGVAFATPAAASCAALAYANSTWIGSKYAYKAGFFLMIAGMILLIPLWFLAGFVCGGFFI